MQGLSDGAHEARRRAGYTLYSNPGGYPFVHASGPRSAASLHCIGLPWKGSQNGFYNLRLSLRSIASDAAVHWLSGGRGFAIDTSTWHVGPGPSHRPALAGIGAGCAAVLAAAAAFYSPQAPRARNSIRSSASFCGSRSVR